MTDQRFELSENLRVGDDELFERWRSGMLTEVGAEVVRAEIERRGLPVPEPVPIAPEVDDATAVGEVDFVTVARSLQSIDIEMLSARLRAEGIETFIADAGINQLNALYSIAVGGVRLMVRRASADQAGRIIDLVRSGRLALRDDEDPG